MIFPDQSDVKNLIHKAFLTTKDVAHYLDIRPTTLSNKLNGYAPLSDEMKDTIVSMCKRQITRNEKRKKNEKLSAEFDSPAEHRSLPRSISAKSFPKISPLEEEA